MTTNLLALETSGRSGSVALSCALQPLRELQESMGNGSAFESLLDRITTHSIELDPRWGSAKTLAPAIEELLSAQGITPADVHAIAVVQGPGSFTGLRVGIATAKVMAYALGIPVIAVDTLDVIAKEFFKSRTQGSDSIDLIAVVDAFRGQSFWAKYQFHDGRCVKTGQTRIDDNECLAMEIQRGSQCAEVFVVGPSLQKLKDCCTQSKHAWLDCQPQAAVVAECGWQAWLGGQTSDIFSLLPMYYRSSAAEEKQSSAKL
ncbi:MAG: tRNA (adenosine(37)-N6)-threonylcarbamoyltransferase complex dimerization subunit type 1 TsaB [Planctomycetota bacterium]|jgi:tRNA threonylcarbamoyladenosine biosynthesis protein TsaB